MSAGSYRSTPRRVAGYLLLTLFAIVFLGPFFIQIATSFKTDTDAANHSLSLVPHPVSTTAWQRLFGFGGDQSVPFGRWLTNSVLVATSITLGRVVLDSLAAYALARMHFRGRKLIFALVLGVLAVPGVVLLIPRFLVLKELTLYNSYAGMILPIMADAAGIFIMRQSFLQIPQELEEAARIDGAGVFRTYWQIVLPLARPALLTLTILSFQSSWNEFSFFLVATSDPKYETLTTGLAKFSSGSLGAGTQYPVNMGAALMATIPVAILFFVFQRQFSGSRLTGGLKG
jgi:multiple sugar transport system permease protein